MSPQPAALKWFVCHTKPRCEKKFAALLEAEEMEHYLPLIESVRRYPSKVERFMKPLFPSYVFARCPLQNQRRLYQQDLLVRLIPVDDEKRFLEQIDQVRTIVASGLHATLQPLIKRGSRVRVVVGPLRGVEGVIDNPEKPEGIVIAIDVLQQGLLVKMPLEHLKPLP